MNAAELGAMNTRVVNPLGKFVTENFSMISVQLVL